MREFEQIWCLLRNTWQSTKYISILDEKDEKNAKKGIPLAEKYIGEEGNDVAARN